MIYPKHITNVEMVPFADDTNMLVTDKTINTLQRKIKRVMMKLESQFSKEITWL
jgi:hypothetical protein